MKRLLAVLAVFVILLLGMAALIFAHAHRAIVAQENAELGYFAGELLKEMEAELARLALEVRNREERTYLPEAQGEAPAAEPAYVVGWVSVRADDTFVTPSADRSKIARRVAALRAAADTPGAAAASADTSRADLAVKDDAGQTERSPREAYQSPLAKRYLSSRWLKGAFPEVDADAIITGELDAAYRAGMARGIESRQASAVERAGGTALRAVILDSSTVFVAATVAADRTDRGVIVAVHSLLRHLARRHYTGEPIAQFTRLELRGRPEQLADCRVTMGEGGDSGRSLQLEHVFAPPFDFLAARLSADAAPPSPSRATLRWLVLVFILVALSGGIVLARAVQAQNDLAQRRARFVSSVTHELKTPLTAIGMYAEMLEQGIDADAATRQRYFGILKSETARLSRLISNVLEFSQLEARRRRVSPAAGNLTVALREAEHVMAEQAAQSGFTLRVEALDDCPAAFDQEAAVQILVNLIENSLKFGVRATRREVVLFVERIARGTRFGVRDYGPGISVQPIERIFDDFQRGDDEITRNTKGTGIGLALVRRLALAMGGRVEAANHQDGGCTVAVVLP